MEDGGDEVEVTVGSSKCRKEGVGQQLTKDRERSSEEVSISCSPLNKRSMLLLKLKDKESRCNGKRKKSRDGIEGCDDSPIRFVKRKLLEGMTPSKVVASFQHRREQ